MSLEHGSFAMLRLAMTMKSIHRHCRDWQRGDTRYYERELNYGPTGHDTREECKGFQKLFVQGSGELEVQE